MTTLTVAEQRELILARTGAVLSREEPCLSETFGIVAGIVVALEANDIARAKDGVMAVDLKPTEGI